MHRNVHIHRYALTRGDLNAKPQTENKDDLMCRGDPFHLHGPHDPKCLFPLSVVP
jgi:hypothetical protein